MEFYEGQTKLYKALMHPVRLAILDILRTGEECVCHMEAALGLRQAYISQQLMVLREAGLVQDRRDGWNIFYHVIKPEIFQVIDAVQKLSGVDISDERIRYKQESVAGSCSCPKCSEIAETA